MIKLTWRTRASGKHCPGSVNNSIITLIFDHNRAEKNSIPPGAGRNVPPVEPPGDDRHWHSDSLTGERHCRPPSCLNRLFWRACHRGRCCEEDNENSFNHIIISTQNGYDMWLAFGDLVEINSCKDREGNIIVCYEQIICFQCPDGSQKQLCVGQHIWETGKMVTVHRGKDGRRRVVHTYCSRTHQIGQDSRALHRTDNWLGCRFDHSDIQTARVHTCHQDLWWLHTFNIDFNHPQTKASSENFLLFV